jgi:hypothetical protein
MMIIMIAIDRRSGRSDDCNEKIDVLSETVTRPANHPESVTR